MTLKADGLPAKPFFRCSPEGFVRECEGGMVHIDFAEGRAQKVTPQGEFVYLGTLEERNEGRGYIAVS